MKYAVINQFGGINRITETQPMALFSTSSYVIEITDEQADMIVAGRNSEPKVIYCYYENEIITQAEKRARIVAAMPVPVPQTVTPWQMRKALNAAGLRATVEAAVSAADQDTKDGWEYASEIRRDNALLNSMAAALNMTSEQLDDLFRTASNL